MVISDKKIQEIKNILEKQHSREFTWEEATKALRDLENLATIAFDIATEEIRREELLKRHPSGFHLDGSGSCLICGNSASEKNSWYDKYGLKCMSCQKAINTKVIPGSIAKNKESWYSKTELEMYFNIKGADLKKYIKQSTLKDRIVEGEGKKVHHQLFLIKDNKDVLPPKKLLNSRIIKVIRDGEEYYSQEYRYEFIDQKLFKRLEKYKIMECLNETLAKPISIGRFFVKQISPAYMQI